MPLYPHVAPVRWRVRRGSSPVTALSEPGLILDTPSHETVNTPEAVAQAIGDTPLRRAGEPGDVAAAVAYLASSYTGFVTGSTLHVTGGSHL